jgi:hypothetical protein
VRRHFVLIVRCRVNGVCIVNITGWLGGGIIDSIATDRLGSVYVMSIRGRLISDFLDSIRDRISDVCKFCIRGILVGTIYSVLEAGW